MNGKYQVGSGRVMAVTHGAPFIQIIISEKRNRRQCTIHIHVKRRCCRTGCEKSQNMPKGEKGGERLCRKNN